MNQAEARELIAAVRLGQYEDSAVEVKAAHRQLPKRLYEALSAFANRTGGGVIVLGLDEERHFQVTGVADPQACLTQLAELAQNMAPPLRLETTVVSDEGKNLAVVEVPECIYTQKPCHYRPAGLNSGSYIRVGNTNRQMTDYEVFGYVTSRSQPAFDREPVLAASLEDLDEGRVTAYLEQVRRDRPQHWVRLRLQEKARALQLAALDIANPVEGVLRPTLAGLLCFGAWPQKFLPSLVVTFVRYPGVGATEKGPRGERFLDDHKCEGSLPEVIETAVSRAMASMRQGLLVEGIFHRTLAEYPEEAIREAIINAVAHRDYSPMGQASQVRVQMYADRLEVESPGGLYGSVNEDNLEEAQSTRNQLLMRFLEDLGLVENRGSGIRAMIAAMREARLEPPRFHDTRNHFRVTFKNATLLNAEALTWLNQFAGHPLNDNQRLALVYLRENEQMTNSDYRRLNNLVDTGLATRELRALVEHGLIEMHASRRWAYYTLSPSVTAEAEFPPLGPQEASVMKYIRERGSINRRECQSLLGITGEQASYVLQRLRDKGRLRTVGERRWTRYVAAL